MSVLFDDHIDSCEIRQAMMLYLKIRDNARPTKNFRSPLSAILTRRFPVLAIESQNMVIRTNHVRVTIVRHPHVEHVPSFFHSVSYET